MSPFPLGTETVTVTRRVPRVDGAGQPVLAAYNRAVIDTVTDEIEGCAVEVTRAAEDNTNTNHTRLEGTALLPWGTAVDHMAAITWLGNEFEVHGPPMPWTDQRGNGDHIEVHIRREKG